MAYNETVNVNINANTSDLDNLEQSLSKQENRIKTLDGAINVLGGSVEILAGGLALSGALSEEQAQKFEGAAVGAIALADGAKRVMDGYKSLSESTKLLTVAQRIYNIVMSANPVFVIIGVLAAVVAGVIALTNATKRNREEQEKYNEAVERANKAQGFYNQLIAEAQARGDSQISILGKQAAAQRARVRGLEDELEALEKIKKPSDEQLERLEELPGLIEEAGNAVTVAEIKVQTESRRIREAREAEEEKARKDRAAKRKEENDKRIAEEKRVQEELAAAALARYQAEIQARADLELQAGSALDAIFNAQLTAQERELNAVQDKYFQLQEFYADDAETLKIITEQREKDIAAVNEKYRKAEEEANTKASDKQKADAKEVADFRSQTITDSIDNIQGALGALFGESKAVAKANVLIDAGQAAVGIIRNSQSTGPLAIAYQASQFALLAATVASSLKQINAAEPGSGGSPDVPGGGGGIPNSSFGVGTSTVGGATGTVAPSGMSAPPIRAYVVTGDVRDGLEAESVLTTRRQFP